MTAKIACKTRVYRNMKKLLNEMISIIKGKLTNLLLLMDSAYDGKVQRGRVRSPKP